MATEQTATPRNESCEIIDQDSVKGFFMKHKGEVVETTRSFEGQNTRGLLFANKFFAGYGPSVKPTMTTEEFIKHPDAQILTMFDKQNNDTPQAKAAVAKYMAENPGKTELQAKEALKLVFYRASIGGSDYYTSKKDVTSLFV